MHDALRVWLSRRRICFLRRIQMADLQIRGLRETHHPEGEMCTHGAADGHEHPNIKQMRYTLEGMR
jgi:hypothetical protein